MPRLSLLFPARPLPTMLAWGLICIAMVSISGFAVAREQGAPDAGNAGQVDQAAEDEKVKVFQSIEWLEGPGFVELGPTARLKVSRGFVFTGPEGANNMLKLIEDPARQGLLGIMAPYDGLDWYIVFESRPTIKKRDGQAKIDADALLRTLQQEDEELNVIRRAQGWAECKVLKWEIPPAFEGSRRDVTWTTKVGEGDEQVFNCTTRIFGREGSIDATLVVAPKDVDRMRPTFRNILSLVEFNDEISDDDSSLGDRAGSYGSSASGPGAGRYATSRMLRQPRQSARLIGGIVFALISAAIGGYRKLRGS